MKIAALGAAALLVLAAGCSCCRTTPAAPAAAPNPHPDAQNEFVKPADGQIKFVEPSKDYPLKTCVVTGEDLREDGEPVAIVCDGTEVQFCCHDCVAKFQKDPSKYLSMVRHATPAK